MSNLPTIRQLEYLVAVARTGNIGRAAKELGVTQPAVSRQLQELEDALGLLLFERTSRGMRLTSSGDHLCERAQGILRQTREMVSEATMLEGEPKGTLRIGAIPTAASYLLDGLVKRLRDRHPGLRLEISEIQTDTLVQRIEDGGIDVGLLALPIESDTLIVDPFLQEPFVFVAERGHPLLGKTPVSVDSLSGMNLLLLGEGHCFRDQALDLCVESGARADTTIEAASFGTLVRLVEAGLGSTLLPLSAVRRELAGSEELGWAAFSGVSPSRTMGLCWRSTSPRHGLMREVAQICREHVPTLQRKVLPSSAGTIPQYRAMKP